MLPRHAFKYFLAGVTISSLFWVAIISHLTNDSMTLSKTRDCNANEREIDQSENREERNAFKESIGIIRNSNDIKKRDEGYNKFAFNLLVSDRIGYHREIPDTRDKLCKRKSTQDMSNGKLPKASIVICFYNEAKSTLLRTIFSIFDRTPFDLIQEIVLVDDYSSEGVSEKELKEKFSSKEFAKVKLLRGERRRGLIRARSKGAEKATGEVLVFLDSHCEVNVGWLPPLLGRIARDRTTVICPIIDIINADTFEYTASPLVKGGFNWGLHFSWDPLTEKDLEDPEAFATPFRSPTMAGGLFAMNRNYFFELGGYDKGMDVWGGENLEISFRIWMCGGTLEFHPCSRVGHVFRDRRPYGNDGKGDTMGFNSQRVAEVWLDKYKMHFYSVRTDLRGKGFGDVSARQKLRNDLKCKSFSWFLNTIYPELYIPLERSGVPFRRNWFKQKKSKILLQGKLQNRQKRLCLDSQGSAYDKKMNAVLRQCDRLNVKYWTHNDANELRTENILCMDVVRYMKKAKIKMMKCHGEKAGQEWRFSKASKTMYNPATGMCLASEKGTRLVGLKICGNGLDKEWQFL